MVDHSGIQSESVKVTAIRQVPVPKNVGNIPHFLGMINQMSKFAETLPEKTKSTLQELLVKDNQWVWNETHQEASDALHCMTQGTRQWCQLMLLHMARVQYCCRDNQEGNGSHCLHFEGHVNNRAKICSNRERDPGFYFGM